MNIIKRRLTRGDNFTQPGGIIMRRDGEEGQFVVHTFNREPGSEHPTEYYWGHYSDDLGGAEEAYRAKLERAGHYTAGGSTIPYQCEREELENERKQAAARVLDKATKVRALMEEVALSFEAESRQELADKTRDAMRVHGRDDETLAKLYDLVERCR